MFTDTDDKSLTCASDCWLQREPSAAAMQRSVRRINPDWVGWLEEQRGSRLVDHHFCWWFAVAFISFTLATARSLCGWRLITRQHMVPLASDHSTTCLSKSVSLPPASPCSWEEWILTGHKLPRYLFQHAWPELQPSGKELTLLQGKCNKVFWAFSVHLSLVNVFIMVESRSHRFIFMLCHGQKTLLLILGPCEWCTSPFLFTEAPYYVEYNSGRVTLNNIVSAPDSYNRYPTRGLLQKAGLLLYVQDWHFRLRTSFSAVIWGFTQQMCPDDSENLLLRTGLRWVHTLWMKCEKNSTFKEIFQKYSSLRKLFLHFSLTKMCDMDLFQR